MSNNVIFCNQTSWFDENTNKSSSFSLVNECVRRTLFVWLPTTFLWILSPVLIFQNCRLRKRRELKPLPHSILSILKHVITVVLFIDSIFLFVNNFTNSEKYSIDFNDEFAKQFVFLSYPLIQAFSMIVMFVCIRLSHKSGLISSGILHLSWVFYAIFSLADIFFWILNDFNITLAHTWAEVTWVLLVFIQAILFCFSDVRNLEDQAKFEKSPEDLSSFLNRQIYWWLNALPKIGSKKDLEMDDLFELSYGSKAEVLVPLWEKYWIPQIEKYNIRKRELLIEGSTNLLLVSSTNGDFFNKEDKQLNKNYVKKLKPPSIIYNLYKMFKWEFISAGLIKAFADVLQFSNPYLLKKLIEYVKESNAPLWHGITYALLMFISSQLRSIAVNYYFYIMFRMGTKIQTTLTAAIYKKTLCLSNASRNSRTSGEIVNLMAIDVDRFQMITNQIQQYWSSPFQITLALVFLFNTLGISAIPGVIIMVIFVPYSVFGSIFAKKWQIEQMILKDKRAKLCSEILNGIKVIKLYAWELPMIEAIERIRKKELLCIFKSGLVRSGIDVFNFTSPFLVAIGSFITFVLVNGDTNLLTPETAFVALALFNQLRSPMTMIGFLINQTVQAIVSNKRMKEFLVSEEVDQDAIERHLDSKDLLEVISINDADFSWGTVLAKLDKEKNKTLSFESIFDPLLPVIQEIKLKVMRGSLTAVVGRVGCGKSSLLGAILGEMEKLRGHVTVRGRIAYVPQTSWIQNMSFRDNILFGKLYKKKLYEAVLEACALKPDLEILPYGDATEIGEKGINLSGGQKARIALARAVYQNCDIYLLDDPLSSVDSHVGKHIFEKVIGPKGLLASKTRLLVTHGVCYLKQSDQIVLLEGKQIQEIGTYWELLANKKQFSELVQEGNLEEELDISNETIQREEKHNLDKTPSNKSGEIIKDYNDLLSTAIDEEYCNDQNLQQFSTISSIDLSDHNPIHSNIEKNLSQTSSCQSRTNIVSPIKEKFPLNIHFLNNGETTKNQFDERRLVQKEHIDTGSVKFAIYNDYMRSAGYLLSFLFAVFFCCIQVFQIGRNIWLSNWSDENDKLIINKSVQTMETIGVGVRLGVYSAFGVAEVFCFFFGLIALIFAGLQASRKLHTPVLKRIMHAPMSFFDTTPSGRILNRLGKDIETIDMVLGLSFRYCIMCITQVVATLSVITYTTPLFSVVIIPLSILYFFILRYYVPTSRQLRRLESNYRSPIYSHFGESIHGVPVIRAFNKLSEFCHEINDRTDRFIRIRYLSLIFNRWLAVRLEFIGNCVVLSAALFAALSKEWGLTATAGLIGLSVSYSLNVTEVLNFAIRQLGDLETNIVSVERLNEYTKIETEAEWTNENKKPPSDWPTTGKLKFEKYATRYRSGLDLVVKNINTEILPGEKIGIVGRTGAGKSSLTLALFRMIEPAEGKIIIDGVDISEIGLHDLRSNITIIPQDPILFSGSLRFNLDPFNRYSDAEVWKALELSHLKTFTRSLPHGLEYEITEGGSNISLGQRQLLCLARALLRRSKILVLDEATAAVDLTTDALIQETIRFEFSKSTILTIAHRLNTIIDYNRVMVLDHGEVIELDSPQALLANPTSVFSSMAADVNLFDEKSL